MKAIESRVHAVGQDCPMARISSLVGRHPSINCLDEMVRYNIGLANLDYVGLVSQARECPNSLDSRRLGPA